MSGNNWLERDPSQSPGLLRVQEAQQTKIAKGKKEAEEAIRQREQNNAENARKLQLQIRQKETQQKLASMKPVLEEIRDFANRTKTYPITSNCVNDNSEIVLFKGAEVVKKEGELELNYAFRGEESVSVLESWDPDHPNSNHYSSYRSPAVHFVGIQLRANNETGEIELFSRRSVTVPAVKEIEPHWVSGKGGYHSQGVREHEAYQKIEECWVPFPDDIKRAQQLLAERFHDPMDLRSILIEDLQDKVKKNQMMKSPLELLIQRIFGSSV